MIKLRQEAITQAVRTLSLALKEDPELRMTYQANIAMAFKDEVAQHRRPITTFSNSDVHEIANKAANAFLNNLTGDNQKVEIP